MLLKVLPFDMRILNEDEDELYYRYEEDRVYSFDFDNETSTYISTRLLLNTFKVIKHTPCGVWISRGYQGKKFILTKAKKRWACPTKEEARKSFLARKNRQKRILEEKLKSVQQAINIANNPEIITLETLLIQ